MNANCIYICNNTAQPAGPNANINIQYICCKLMSVLLAIAIASEFSLAIGLKFTCNGIYI